MLFDPNLSYPSDREGGRYVELSGLIVRVGTFDAGQRNLREIEIAVQTGHGEQRGWWRTPVSSTFQAKAGMRATVRVYDAGGGWYPSNRIIRIEL